jgi:hypothetical protein
VAVAVSRGEIPAWWKQHSAKESKAIRTDEGDAGRQSTFADGKGRACQQRRDKVATIAEIRIAGTQRCTAPKKKNAEHCNSVRPSSRCHSLSKGLGQVRAPERRGGLQVKVKVKRKATEDAPLGGSGGGKTKPLIWVSRRRVPFSTSLDKGYGYRKRLMAMAPSRLSNRMDALPEQE